MKSIKYSIFGVSLLLAGALSSCQDSYDAPTLDSPVASLKPNTTLMELKDMITEEAGANTNVAILAGEKDGEPIVIHGRVISCDASGNIYQTLYIQDETTAFAVSVRKDKMWSWYREGQDVVIDVTGLYIGLYNGLYQIGWMGEYHEAKALTFLSWDMFRQHCEVNGLPNQNFRDLDFSATWPSEDPYYLVTDKIADINNFQGGNAKIQGQLVEIQNVTWEDAGVETFAPYQESVNRTIIDAYGNSLTVRNSGYSDFYNRKLPTGTGNVRGILSYFNGWQLLLRSIDDVMFETMAGDTQEDALTVSEAINLENLGRNLWVKGYVVGSVKGNVSEIRSNDDIIFGKDADFPNTVVIAENADEKNFQNCIVVELPFNTPVQEDVNLVDNPDVYGKLLYIRGNLREYLGLSGITDASTEYYYEGMPTEEDAGGTFLTSNMEDFTIDIISMDLSLSFIWAWDASYTCAKASAFVGSAKASDSYLVSPVIKVPRRPTATFEQALNKLNGYSLSDHVEVCVREGSNGTWNKVNVTNWPAGTTWNFNTSNIDLNAYAGKEIQIGFHYTTTNENAPTWEVKNLVIK